ncbi:hypothetical protein [Flaviaesturariibacter amylovorans]|uniref:Lipoprotein n=1 Tax=Flaviaesturariibacter amylovorans TaxID=1084520 RepID=A0ABP8H9E0_9BACT
MRNAALLFLITLVVAGCQPPADRTVERGFYYWKTTFDPTPKEQEYLRALNASHLYLRLFDVDLNEQGKPAPVGTVQINSAAPPDVRITPVVFITQEVLRRSDSTALEALAPRMARLMEQLCAGLPLSGELQLDCDWSAGTRDRYFCLLRALQRQPFVRSKTLSVTIRLHQLKYRAASGLPPAAKGLLMCYNMGDLRDPKVRNSIIDPGVLEPYIGGLRSYPLPLDVALPVFQWNVWFEGGRYKGLVYLPDSLAPRSTLDFTRDSTIGGYRFRAGDRLRPERSDAESVRRAASAVAKRLPSGQVRVLLFALDEQNLAAYTHDELEAFYDRLRHRPPRLAAAERDQLRGR